MESISIVRPKKEAWGNTFMFIELLAGGIPSSIWCLQTVRLQLAASSLESEEHSERAQTAKKNK